MIFQHTIDKVLDGSKTQTSRIVKPDHMDWTHDVGRIFAIANYGRGFDDPPRVLYEVDKTYAVQPGRGKKAVARIRVVGISRYDVREATDEDVKREGFDCHEDFWLVWISMHDKRAFREYASWYEWLALKNFPVLEPSPELTENLHKHIHTSIKQGEVADYDAWKIIFELV